MNWGDGVAIGIFALAAAAIIAFGLWINAPIGYPTFQPDKVVSDEGYHYVRTTDDRVFRFDGGRADWILMKPNCRYSAVIVNSFGPVPVITDVKKLGCEG